MDRLTMLARASLSAAALVALVAACGSDDAGGAIAQIRQFCASYTASPTFSCCTGDDRNEPSFVLRYRFRTAGDCEDTLTQQVSQSSGKQGFDSVAAQSCLDYLSKRPCGSLPLANVRREEQNAGCFKVLSGVQDENQSCNSSDDCKPGLVCPPIKETGLSFCAKPAGFNQDCIGEQAASVDHPACQPGLFCSFIGENEAGCPNPPCLQFKCVPPFEEGDPCGANECADGLVCKDGTCQKGQPNGVDGFCRVPEHCAEGLYCDTAAGKCAEQKADGAECNPANNPLFECKGICKGSGTSGTCAGFCGH